MTSSTANTPTFWDHFWRTAGIQFAGFFIVTAFIYGYQPPVGASSDVLAAFDNGERTRILIAAALSGLNLLNLLWFAAALTTALSDAGQEGWGTAAGMDVPSRVLWSVPYPNQSNKRLRESAVR